MRPSERPGFGAGIVGAVIGAGIIGAGLIGVELASELESELSHGIGTSIAELALRP